LNLGKLQQISKLSIDDLSDGTALLLPELEFELGARLAHISGWIVNDDGAAIGQSVDRVAGIARYNPH
jgi:hypothetical protein